ncbi:MAG: sulfatase-like hydrolase/transferase [Tropicimonas sp.]|uniref:sulfatase-like hydrolase/transferase n=1 Tax=Tropicimonas sp. TaxID=2067044 RepID=UPI003A83E72C
MSDQPHVLFITVDQWPAHLLGCLGHPEIETPTLDTLARSGTLYTSCYAETPICIPSRRSMMTGRTARGHGDRDFQTDLPMPPGATTLAGAFSAGGYQTNAIGKLHVYPPRDRIGFDEALLAEEGRGHLGGPDDYEMFLADNGHPGEQFLHGMSNNEYFWNTWHLDDELHVTNWTTRSAARQIKRRDPTRPGFWHVSYTHPHPPLAPLSRYLDRYARREIGPPVAGEWSAEGAALPPIVGAVRNFYARLPAAQLADTRRAFYALCTHIDHQIRLLIGTLREEGILERTVIVFASDHGDMLGDHGLFGKRLMYDGSARVPLLVIDRREGARIPANARDDRLVMLHDLMPSMLELAGLPVPEGVEGRSLLAPERRDHIYGESHLGTKASRMVRDARHKLIWYPAGNCFQLFDMQEDPLEQRDLAADPGQADVLARLQALLRGHLYGEDLELVDGERFIGLPAFEPAMGDNRGLSGQRGFHYPQVPPSDPSVAVGAV